MVRLPDTGERYGDQRLVSLLASMTSLPGLSVEDEAPLPAAVRARFAEFNPPLSDRTAAKLSGLSSAMMNRLRRGIPPTWDFRADTATKLADFLGVSEARVREMAAESARVLQADSETARRGYEERIVSDVGNLSEPAQAAVSYLVSYLLAEQTARAEMDLAIRNLVRVLISSDDDPAPAAAIGSALRSALSRPDVPTHINALPPQVVSALSDALGAALEQSA